MRNAIRGKLEIKRLRGNRIPASTLLEVLVAMAIAGLMFGIGTMIWLRLNDAVSPPKLLAQRLVAREMIFESEQEGKLQDETRQEGVFRYMKQVRAVNVKQGLYEVSVTVIGPGEKRIGKRSKIVRFREEQL